MGPHLKWIQRIDQIQSKVAKFVKNEYRISTCILKNRNIIIVLKNDIWYVIESPRRYEKGYTSNDILHDFESWRLKQWL